MKLPILMGVLLLGGTTVGAEVYQWEDRSGVVHFTDSPDRIPSEYRGKALRREVDPLPGYAFPQAAPPLAPPSSSSVPSESATVPAGGRGGEAGLLETLENERRAAVEEVERTHRRYVISLGTKDSTPGALNLISQRRKEYQDARSRLAEIEKRIDELKRNGATLP